MKKIFFVYLLLASQAALSAPNGAQLLFACEDALQNGFHSERGMLCIWYVTPCDCNFGNRKDLPRVCLPKQAQHEDLAELVIIGLREQITLQIETAEMAANTILAETYPCTDQSRNN